jgi:integrase
VGQRFQRNRGNSNAVRRHRQTESPLSTRCTSPRADRREAQARRQQPCCVLTFAAEETKTGVAIDEPCPGDLIPYLEAYLKQRRPVLLAQAKPHASGLPHRRLWTDRSGKSMAEATLRSLIKRYTRAAFGVAVWPHLFRDCLLTTLAIDQPDLMGSSARLLGHASLRTGEKHYDQALMVDASRQYGRAILELRQGFVDAIRSQLDDPY